MKSQIVNYIFGFNAAISESEILTKNIQGFSKNQLALEIEKIKPQIIAENFLVHALIMDNLNIIKTFSGFGYDLEVEKLINQNRHIETYYSNLEIKKEEEVLQKYCHLFNVICWQGKVLVKLKNEIILANKSEEYNSLFSHVVTQLKRIDNLINNIDYITSEENKKKLDFSNDNLPLIKLYNMRWLFIEFSKNCRLKYKCYDVNKNKMDKYFQKMETFANDIYLNYNVNSTNEQIDECFKEAKKLFLNMQDKLKKMENKYLKSLAYKEDYKELETINESFSLPGILEIGKFFIDWAEEIREQDQKERDQKLEKLMNDMKLENWQKELVRKGEYDPWSFEEGEDLEEGDYYYEDLD